MPIKSKSSIAQTWAGQVSMTVGFGVFIGESGDNAFHKHWSHQIAISLDSDIEVRSHDDVYSGKGVWIPAGTIHQLNVAKVLCLYIDPTNNLCKTLLPKISSQEKSLISLDNSLISRLLLYFHNVENLELAVHAFNQPCGCIPLSSPDKKLQSIIAILKKSIGTEHDTSRTMLAKQVKLSPTRFSHWFTEQTGLPLRSYKKWLKLLMGLELSRTMTLTEAAMATGFSDQAHFCRAVSDAFGVKPTTIKQLFLDNPFTE